MSLRRGTADGATAPSTSVGPSVESSAFGDRDHPLRDPRPDAPRSRAVGDARPVFIFGAPYSGATLLAWSLAQHPAFEPVPGRAAVEEVAEAVRAIETDLAPRLALELGSVLRAVVPADPHTANPCADVFDVLARYFGKQAGAPPGARRTISVAAVYASQSHLLSELFPHARFIHVVRDVESVVRAATQLQAVSRAEAVDSWARVVSAAVATERALGSCKVLRLSYPALVCSPRRELRRCLRFLGEDEDAGDCSWPLRVIGRPFDLAVDEARKAEAVPLAFASWSRRLLNERPRYSGDPERLGRLRIAAAPFEAGHRLARTPFHELVAAVVPETHSVLVVSRGDDQLLRLGNRRAQHFPQADDGAYAGFHPAATADVVDQLARLRRRGARYLAFPSSSYWWFDFYVGLEEHLREIGHELVSGAHCRVFALDHPLPECPSTAPHEDGTVREPENDRAFTISAGVRTSAPARTRLDGEFWAISTFYNPAQYRNKIRNYRRFRDALQQARIPLLTVETAFGDDAFELHTGDADRLVQLRANDVLWQKERMVNLALRHLPDECDKVAWLDADVLFTSPRWVDDTSKLLREHVVVQPFSHCVRLARDQTYCDAASLPFGGDEGKLFYGVAFGVYANGRETLASYSVAGHPGYAWAARRSFLEKHGLYDRNLFANGDMDFAQALWGNRDYFALDARSAKAREDVWQWTAGVTAAASGGAAFADGLLLHLWHGAHRHRSYDRALDVMKTFDPQRDLTVDPETGLYQWGDANEQLQRWARTYFSERREE